MQRCANGGQLLPKLLGVTTLSEEIDFDVTGQTTRVTKVRGRYFASFRHKLTLSENQTGSKIVAVDPGVRTFATTYSLDEVNKYGDGLQTELLNLSQRLDRLNSVRDKLPTNVMWADQRRNWLQGRIWNLANRRSDLVTDLHRRVAHDLVTNYDIILLPTFQTQQMVKTGSKRKIRKNTVRAMQQLRFFEFAQHLEWMCKKYGKTLIRVNEAYTSKTDSRTGVVKQVGGAKSINGLDRDTNGARGILLRALSRGAHPQITSKSGKKLSLLSV